MFHTSVKLVDKYVFLLYGCQLERCFAMSKVYSHTFTLLFSSPSLQQPLSLLFVGNLEVFDEDLGAFVARDAAYDFGVHSKFEGQRDEGLSGSMGADEFVFGMCAGYPAASFLFGDGYGGVKTRQFRQFLEVQVEVAVGNGWEFHDSIFMGVFVQDSPGLGEDRYRDDVVLFLVSEVRRFCFWVEQGRCLGSCRDCGGSIC